jgi:hypothetical protein
MFPIVSLSEVGIISLAVPARRSWRDRWLRTCRELSTLTQVQLTAANTDAEVDTLLAVLAERGELQSARAAMELAG